ncbi:transglycosylase SLT domain-containing protein [Psychrobacter sp.]|uniref:transglycosylase SLT domain-containing protein n=1 Tax=Psychrobacter sp. TaxID=56811 RepID=UPI0025EC5EBC|nr:transglycosylase SLT domain-containing protein [Psychrobacter sp.]
MDTSMLRLRNWINHKNNHRKNTQCFTSNVFSIPSSNGKYVLPFIAPPKLIQTDSKRPKVKKKFAKLKMLMQISSIALLSLPAQSLTTALFTNEEDAYDSVLAANTLTLASVKGNSTYFSTDRFEHGFGYDIARSYAYTLGVELVVKEFQTDAEALNALRDGDADMALTTASTKLLTESGLASMNISCGYDSTLVDNGLHPKTNWSFRSNADPLAIKASHYICDDGQLVNTAKIANFYDQTLLEDDYNRKHFEKALTTNLPSYKSSFQKQANIYNHDWQLLVAMGYQESHLNANATSPTGVRGLMMLTNNTAKAMGVSDRVDPYQSIGGGARYLEQMKETFSEVPNPDRLWFALASYNMGPNAIKDIQQKLANKGQNPNSWANVYAYMSNNAIHNSRYTQCMHYVTNIRSYLETLKTRTV